MEQWFVIQTQLRNEERALQHLRNQGFDCFLPRFRKSRRHARKTDMVIEPLFPQYLFARFDAEEIRWRVINGTRGVVAILTDGTRPIAVPSGVIESLQINTDQNGVTSLASLGLFREGARVRIKSGAFAGQFGEIKEVLSKGADRVRVLLALLGAQTCLDLPSYALETA